MADQLVPDDSLKRLRVRGYGGRIHRWDAHERVRNTPCIATIPADYPEHLRTHLARILHCRHQVGTDVPQRVAATDREYENPIGVAQATDLQPADKRALPAFVVDTSRELGNIVGGCI